LVEFAPRTSMGTHAHPQKLFNPMEVTRIPVVPGRYAQN
jgi:hypothetical protein